MFGEQLTEQEVLQAQRFLEICDSVLVVGSTVSVWPASEVVFNAARALKPVVVVNKGETEADGVAQVKLDAGIGDVLPDLVDRLLGQDTPNS